MNGSDRFTMAMMKTLDIGRRNAEISEMFGREERGRTAMHAQRISGGKGVIIAESEKWASMQLGDVCNLVMYAT